MIVYGVIWGLVAVWIIRRYKAKGKDNVQQ